MTNVKLKLMFFLLNSLLSADIVQARPYSDGNVTDMIMDFSSNSTFSIPIDSNSDTLIVASREETVEEMNKNSDTQMEAIVNAEQDRDEDLTEKTMKEQPNVLGIPKDDARALEQQLNISSPLLDEMMDSESDREESLTDILFKSDSEFAEPPRFEFLIAGKINESDNQNFTKDSGFSDNNLDKVDRNTSDILRKMDYVELVEVLKPSKMNENKSAYNLGNITGHEVDNDLAPDTRFSDVQTLFLASLATMLLLFVVFVLMVCALYVYRRCCRLPSASSASDSSDKPAANHQQLKSSTDDVTADGDMDEDAPANGSIFTMTLKNNHLIVETEERNDIARNGRETKMKYSPDNDGIFVVEVQQSTAYRPNNKALQSSPSHDPQISTNQALIHRVPEDFEKKILEEDSERSSLKYDKQAWALSSTGLSISDLSMSSIGSHNISYTYSSQMGYEQGPFGYPIYSGYNVSKEDVGDSIVHDNSQEPLIGKTPTDPDRPVVTAAIFKQDSIISNDALQRPGYCIEGSSDGPLLSDVQAREYSLQHLHDQKEKNMENGVAVTMYEKAENRVKTFSRADSLPMQVESDVPQNEVKAMDTIKENVPSKDNLKGKRASLPVINTNIYDSEDAISTESPKLEEMRNNIFPGDSSYDSPPMITITEESESGKSDSTS